MVDAFLGTTSGVLRLRDGALEPLGLEGRRVTALHASDDALLAGTYGDGLFRSADGGRTWKLIEAGLTACSSPRPTARFGRSARAAACSEQRRMTGRGPPCSRRTPLSTSSRSRSPDPAETVKR